MINLLLNKSVSNKVVLDLKNGGAKTKEAIRKALFAIGQEMRDEAGTNAPYKTGNLRRSITTESTEREARVGTNLVYARIHDLGGTIPAQIIRPKKASVLRFTVGGKVVFAKFVRRPAVHIKPYKGRGYLTPAFKKMKEGRAAQIIQKFMDRVLSKE